MAITDMPAVRRADERDIPALALLKRRTFRETFVDGPIAIPYSDANLAIFEAQSYSEDAVARELADPRRAQWVAATAEGELAGYAHVGPCKLPHAEAGSGQGELFQLYVAEAWQGFGLGRALLDDALDWLEREMPGPVWLGVFSRNIRAQAVYEARGFEKVGEYEFQVGDHRDHEYIMRRVTVVRL